MFNEPMISLLDLALSISNVVDLMAPEVADHHQRVAYMAVCIAKEMGLPKEVLHKVVIAGLLHDIGALARQERTSLMRCDIEEMGGVHIHAQAGQLLLRKFSPLIDVANIIRFHHVPWNHGAGQVFCGENVPVESHILHLADRLDVFVSQARPVHDYAEHIGIYVSHGSGTLFPQDVADAFMRLGRQEYFWLDTVLPSLERELCRYVKSTALELSMDELLGFAKVMAHVIDFRSRFTATHSCGVAAVAEMLAGLVGFSEIECRKMKIAGYLHDIGKLAIPAEILEKQGRLANDELRAIRAHPYYTYRILKHIEGLEDITLWASMHHERLNGDGYPFRCPSSHIPLGSRIVAVADVFTALTEDRPYRTALGRNEVASTLKRMARNMQLEKRVVAVLLRHYDELVRCRHKAQEHARNEYEAFLRVIGGVARQPISA